MPGRPAGGLPAADAFLKAWIPRIQKSKAYADGGLIVITTDQAPVPEAGTTGATGATGFGGTGATGAQGAASDRCCLSPTFPNVPAGQPGGGRVGLLLLSEDLETPGSTVEDPTNHFDLLRSLQDGFALARSATPRARRSPACRSTRCSRRLSSDAAGGRKHQACVIACRPESASVSRCGAAGAAAVPVAHITEKADPGAGRPLSPSRDAERAGLASMWTHRVGMLSTWMSEYAT